MKIRLTNGEVFELLRHREIGENLQIEIIREDIISVIQSFNVTDNITSLSIIDESGNTVAKYDGYTTNVSMSKDSFLYFGEEIERIILVFKRTDYVTQFNNIKTELSLIQEQLNPTVDIDAMSIEEYRIYKKTEIGEQCRSEIYKGIDFELDGELQHFTYNIEDQMNFAIGKQNCDDGFLTIPYHNSANNNVTQCYKFYEASVFKDIYMKQFLNKIEKTTRCNAIFMWIDSLSDKEQIKEITFSSEIPEEFAENYRHIVESTESIINSIQNNAT